MQWTCLCQHQETPPPRRQAQRIFLLAPLPLQGPLRHHTRRLPLRQRPQAPQVFLLPPLPLQLHPKHHTRRPPLRQRLQPLQLQLLRGVRALQLFRQPSQLGQLLLHLWR